MKKTYFKHRFINFKFPLKSAFNIPISIISYDIIWKFIKEHGQIETSLLKMDQITLNAGKKYMRL